MLVQLAALRRAGALAAAQGPRRFGQHQPADTTKDQHIGQGNDKIDLAYLAQEAEHLHARGRTDEAAEQQHEPHAEIDIAAAHVRQHAGHRRGDDLGRLRADGDGRRHADEDEERRHQEAAADSEQAGEQAYAAAERQDDEHIHGDFGDRQVDQHRIERGPEGVG